MSARDILADWIGELGKSILIEVGKKVGQTIGERITKERKMTEKNIEDFVAPEDDAATSPGEQLNNLITEMAALELKKRKLEADLAEVKDQLKTYQQNLIPAAMDEMMADRITTNAGLEVIVKNQIFASFPKDPAKREQAFAYLRETGNDGLVKHEISIKYGRDSTELADQVMEKLREMNVDKEARVEQRPTIHHQSLCKFLRDEREAGKEVPLEAFGAFEMRVATIKF